MRGFHPDADGEPGIRMASFNLREGRFRQSNLHLTKAARIGNRHYIEAVYAQRYQLRVGPVLRLGWRILRTPGGGFPAIWDYALLHAAGLAHRRGWGRVADRLRARIPLSRVEQRIGALLQTEFRFVVTQAGGCAVDIDTEEHYDAARTRFESWRAAQAARAELLYGRVQGVAPHRGGLDPGRRQSRWLRTGCSRRRSAPAPGSFASRTAACSG